jgi:hypothetical protein
MNSLRLVAYLVLVMGLMSCAPMEPERAAKPAGPPVPIVPGERVGEVKLGMFVDDVVRVLGKPSEIRKAPHTVFGGVVPLTYEYDDGNLAIEFFTRPPSQVSFIKIYSARYVTDRGIKVGSSASDVVRAYGGGYVSENNELVYYERGIHFLLDNKRDEQPVRRIQIMNRLPK